MTAFSEKLLIWYDQFGRKNLPWQQDRQPYRVWVSEIMLQQTQVTTVIPYYERFIQRFPDIRSLASAPDDDVMHHWSGLGYYARARNLQKAAQQIMQRHNGVFPDNYDDVIALSGIGASTAGAILAFCFNQRQPILDGNVKRVLCRYHGVEGYPGVRKVHDRLWQIADQHTPASRVADYTQAIMDLGATLCMRNKPLCAACPCNQDCAAYAAGTTSTLPTRKPKKNRPRRIWQMLVIYNDKKEVLLLQNPPSGIWGGLWSLPTIEENTFNADNFNLQSWCESRLGMKVFQEKVLTEVKHGFTHFELTIQPSICRTCEIVGQLAEDDGQYWYATSAINEIGLPAPVKKLLDHLTT